MFMPNGMRREKKPTLVLPVEKPVLRGGYCSGFRLLQGPNKYTPQEFHGVFEGWEYRFWCLSSYSNGVLVTECRACGSIGGPTKKSRSLHAGVGKCYKRLLDAYKLLARDQRCVICDVKTHKEKWGVLLCGSGCQQAWCEQEATPAALQAALKLVGDPL